LRACHGQQVFGKGVLVAPLIWRKREDLLSRIDYISVRWAWPAANPPAVMCSGVHFLWGVSLKAKNLIFAFLVLFFATLTSQAQMVVSSNLEYVEDSDYPLTSNLLDVYMPEDANDVPVILFFHWGALVGSDKSDGEVLGRRFSAMGYGVVSSNYRLSPEVSHPLHTQDAAAALAWVANNIDSYGGDPKNIHLVGHSSGGYLAALLTLDYSYLETLGVDRSIIKGTVLISPFLYVEETAPDRIAQDDRATSIWGVDPKAWLAASVTPHIGPGQENILVIYADGDDDWRKNQNLRFASAMRAAGNENIRAVEVSDRTHRSIVFSILDEDDQIGKLMSEFIEAN